VCYFKEIITKFLKIYPPLFDLIFNGDPFETRSFTSSIGTILLARRICNEEYPFISSHLAVREAPCSIRNLISPLNSLKQAICNGVQPPV
jgi:hypothetical protein